MQSKMQDAVKPSRIPRYDLPWTGSQFWSEQRVKTEEEFKKLASEMKRPVSEFPWDIPGMKNMKNTSRTLWMHLHMCAWKGLIQLTLSDDLNVGLYGILGFAVLPQHLEKYNEGLFPIDQLHHKLHDKTDGSYPGQRHALMQTWYTAGFSERKTHTGVVLVSYSETLYERMKNQNETKKMDKRKPMDESGPPKKSQVAVKMEKRTDEPGAFKKPRKEPEAVIDVDQWIGPDDTTQPLLPPIAALPLVFFSPIVVHSATKAAEDRVALAEARLKVVNMEYAMTAADYQRAVVDNGRAFAEMQRADAQFKHTSAEFQKKNTELVQAKLEVRAAYTAVGELKAK